MSVTFKKIENLNQQVSWEQLKYYSENVLCRNKSIIFCFPWDDQPGYLSAVWSNLRYILMLSTSASFLFCLTYSAVLGTQPACLLSGTHRYSVLLPQMHGWSRGSSGWDTLMVSLSWAAQVSVVSFVRSLHNPHVKKSCITSSSCYLTFLHQSKEAYPWQLRTWEASCLLPNHRGVGTE